MLFKHIRTGNVYQVLFYATIEATNQIAVVYQRADMIDPVKWVRPLDEFEEKFTRLKIYQEVEEKR